MGLDDSFARFDRKNMCMYICMYVMAIVRGKNRDLSHVRCIKNDDGRENIGRIEKLHNFRCRIGAKGIRNALRMIKYGRNSWS